MIHTTTPATDRPTVHDPQDVEFVPSDRVAPHVRGAAITSIVFGGAIFGFFYAWVCSTMWGLDAADPRVAIAAMQAMNGSVRNAVFFPAFFLTPVVLGGTALLCRAHGHRRAAGWFGLAAGIYFVGGLVLTMAINVPMNEDLATVVVPSSVEEARVIWDDYSGRWQVFNQLRTVASGVSLAVAGLGLSSLPRR